MFFFYKNRQEQDSAPLIVMWLKIKNKNKKLKRKGHSLQSVSIIKRNELSTH